MDNIFKFFLMISVLMGFSVSTMANENAEKKAIEKVKDALLMQVNAQKFEKRIDRKIQNIVKTHSKTIMSNNMMLGLAALTHTILKKEISYSKTNKNKQVNIVLREDDISFNFSFRY